VAATDRSSKAHFASQRITVPTPRPTSLGEALLMQEQIDALGM
jgi:hypothetical protein